MLLTLKNIVAGYGNITALKGISLSVPEGKIVTLIGANGAGKSTTMKTIMGLMKPSEGEILFKDKSITGQKSFHIVNAGVVLVPEGRQILQNMTVREDLELGAYQRKDKAEIREDMVKVFQRFPRLLEREKQFGGTLSGGEQQMLAIGRALIANPRMILLDEPSLGLAPLIVAEIFEAIREINREGTTVLFVEQNSKIALTTAQRGYVLQTGHMILTDTCESLLHNEDVRKAYLGEE